MKNSEILIAAKALIATPAQWTKDSCARDGNGRSVEGALVDEGKIGFPGASCFCTYGAMYEVLGREPGKNCDAWDYLEDAVGISPISFNDSPDRGHSDVLEMFNKAIALALADEVAE
jgi:hypothetical protein